MVSYIYKFYKSQVTGGGYMPQGNCLATLTLDENRTPSWSDMTEEFENFCLPWFSNTVRMGVIDNLAPLVPYSEEALQHLSKHQLPSQGFVMVEIQGPPKPKSTPGSAAAPAKAPQAPPARPGAPVAPVQPVMGFHSSQPMYAPPPGLFKTPPSPPPEG